jgi:ribosomal protein L35
MKSNKSYLKRVKVTKNGKLVARKPGQDHFNAKESRKNQLSKKRTAHFSLSNKAKSRYFVHA